MEKKSKRENGCNRSFYIRVTLVDRRGRASVLVVNNYKFSKIIQLDIYTFSCNCVTYFCGSRSYSSWHDFAAAEKKKDNDLLKKGKRKL